MFLLLSTNLRHTRFISENLNGRALHSVQEHSGGEFEFVETATDLQSARKMATNLARYNECEFVIVDGKRRIVASYGHSQTHPEDGRR